MATFDKEQLLIPVGKKNPLVECGPDHSPYSGRKSNKTSMLPHPEEYCPRSPPAAMLWRAAVKVVGVGWAQIAATFDLKVASPLLVLRDAWQSGPALI